ncbi:hypothetical protein SELMODRAFT_117054 [Selaginella moellendorffii]|uniref:Uncharacterized protein n=1 Tax=Selaginella moellendorffii TaxID=88036 RepID=D8SHX2_SELML|nr:aquaporin SIP1-1 [Selaginella moellendorffii]EFJ16069.1 hypothetical protein SELMODRAFT_117054 [Selaginella moellendorffii]|eukprot:XP_002982824.1 aquaporin SIP1-1 [Selaginella moellendorffii]
MGMLKLILADAAISFLWVFCTSCIGAATEIIASCAGVEGDRKFYIVFGLIALLIIVFSALAQAIGGASWNPTAVLAFSGVGVGDSIFNLALRIPAQAVGSAAGALAIFELMPSSFKGTLGGPSLKVDLRTGAIAEGLLSFIMSFVVLWAVLRGPRNAALKSGIIISTTIALIVLGSGYTGPAMNPANAFAWAYVNKSHNTNEHLYVYWLTPLLGSLAASMVFKRMFALGQNKEKTA